MLKTDLPKGFSLIDDGHFVSLSYKGRKIAAFSARSVNPEEVKKVAERYPHQEGGESDGKERAYF